MRRTALRAFPALVRDKPVMGGRAISPRAKRRISRALVRSEATCRSEKARAAPYWIAPIRYPAPRNFSGSPPSPGGAGLIGQMRPGGPAGRAEPADHLADLDRLSDADADLGE